MLEPIGVPPLTLATICPLCALLSEAITAPLVSALALLMSLGVPLPILVLPFQAAVPLTTTVEDA